jgi:AcrR family transcriptional regulator
VAPPSNDRAASILEAALRTLARQGADNFSIVNIAREAHVSRRTIYRYYSSTEDILAGVAEYVGGSFARAIEEAVSATPDLDRRFEVVMTATMRYGDYQPAAIAVMRMEPAFTIEFLSNTIGDYVDVIRAAIAPVIDRVPAVTDGRISEEQLAELIIRIGISGFLIPSQVLDTMPAAMASLMTGPKPPRRRR